MNTYRIVVGIDGSAGSGRALRWAARDARIRGGTVQAILTYEWPITEAALVTRPGPQAQRKIAEDVANTVVGEVNRAYPEVPIAVEVLRGNAVRTLASAAQHADVLVVGSHGHGHLRHAVLGSVSEGCIQLAPCPVVVVPDARDQATPAHLEMVPSATAEPAP